MNKVIITIGRESGSGGNYIGKQVAKKLNIPFYDKELIDKVCEKTGVSYAKLEANDEKANKNNILNALNLLNSGNYEDVYQDDTCKVLIKQTIEQLANIGSCVILGRNSNNVLKNNKNAINIFIYSNDIDFKIKRKMELEGKGYEETAKKLRKIDNQRKKYYESVNNGQIWGDKKNYDYCIDSSILGVDKTVDLIIDIVNKK